MTRARVRRSSFTFAALLCLALLPGALRAEPFVWKSRFTEASSKELAALHESIHAAHATALRAHPVSGLVWTEQDFTLEMTSGTLFLEPPIGGVTLGAFFEGSGVVRFAPSDDTARSTMKTPLGMETLEAVAVTSAYVFTLRADSPLAGFAAARGGTAQPAKADVYEADKSAMRQLGLDLTEHYLNREGPSLGASYVLFPMQEIRGSRSPEARLLYSFVPIAEQGVTLSVFGHEEMVAVKPYKFRFYPLASYEAAAPASAPDIRRSVVDISLGKVDRIARESALLELMPPAGAKALRFDFTITMEVTDARLGESSPLAFLQWQELDNDPDFDQTILLRLPEPAVEPLSLTVVSRGELFDGNLGFYYLVDEDAWFPRAGYRDEALHELRLTIPKEQVGIGVGEKVEERVDGPLRTVAFRSTHPMLWSTFYSGDFTVTESRADDITVELYQFRQSINAAQNAGFAVTEIANALKVFSRMFGLLDIDTMRVTSTARYHGRGFEGLLLLGAGGAHSVQTWADLFRAHEVAHQWWGNMVRIQRWPRDRWIMESFAEYAAMEYYKIRFENHKRALEVMREHWLDPLTLGTMKYENLIGDKEKLQGRTIVPLAAGGRNVYTKGPLVIHMLRYLFSLQKNERAFFNMIRDFVAQFRYKAASTDDFRRIAEQHLGSDLGWFFEQWIDDGGVPVLRWSWAVERSGDKFLLKLSARQEQKAYRLDVPVYIHFSGETIVRPWRIEDAEGQLKLLLPARPKKVTLSDNLESLAIMKFAGEGASPGQAGAR